MLLASHPVKTEHEELSDPGDSETEPGYRVHGRRWGCGGQVSGPRHKILVRESLWVAPHGQASTASALCQAGKAAALQFQSSSYLTAERAEGQRLCGCVESNGRPGRLALRCKKGWM